MAKTQLQAYQMGMLSSFLPAFLLSGFVYSIENMPAVIQVITHVVPARYFVTILKGDFPEGRGARASCGASCCSWRCMRSIVFLLATRKLQPEGGVNAMWERIRVILRKEFIQALREPRMRVLLFLPPMMQLIVFGFAVNLDVDHARIAWMDMDRTPESRDLRDALRRVGPLRHGGDAGAVKRTCSACWTGARCRRWCACCRASRAISARGRATEVQVLIDGTNSNTASLVSSYAGQIIAEYSADVMERPAEHAGAGAQSAGRR